jgi:transposase
MVSNQVRLDLRVLVRPRPHRRPPPKLTQCQLDLAQHMYDSQEHTVEEIAQTFHVSRPTMYRHLTAANQGKDFVLIVYRNTRRKKVDAHNNRCYGETGASEKVQYDADRMWWNIAPAQRHHRGAHCDRHVHDAGIAGNQRRRAPEQGPGTLQAETASSGRDPSGGPVHDRIPENQVVSTAHVTRSPS